MERIPRRGLEKLQKEQYYKEDCYMKSKKETEADRKKYLLLIICPVVEILKGR